MSYLVKGVGASIGYARERHYEKQRQKSEGGENAQPNESADANVEQGNPLTDEDEADWIMEDVQQQNQDHPKKSVKGRRDVDELVEYFIRNHPPPHPPLPRGNLQAPVILPQRRPQSKQRGFVRAYSPVLEDCGISQKTWLEFLTLFDEAIESSPWFHVFNAAVLASHAVPSVTVHFIAMACHISIEAARRMQVSRQENSFLDKVNASYFRPHGLYCLVMAYDPESSAIDEYVDVSGKTNEIVADRDSAPRMFPDSVKSSSGKTGEFEMPESAPLVFPEFDALPQEKKESGFKAAHGRAVEYRDKRAQAKYNAQAPDTQLGEHYNPQFSSRYADPVHPANYGNLLALVTGGKFNPRAEILGAIRGRPSTLTGATSEEAAAARQYEQGSGKGGLLTNAKRKMKEKILYLMVVNMPSDQEMQEAMAKLQSRQL